MALPDLNELASRLHRIDGRSYNAYKQISGPWRAGGWILRIDHVQGDPFAQPSRVRAVFEPGRLPVPPEFRSSGPRRTACADFLTRRLACSLREGLSRSAHRRGSGRSGAIELLGAGQQVLARTCMVVRQDGEVEARFCVGLPAQGRRIMGGAAVDLLTDELPRLLIDGLTCDEAGLESMGRHIDTVEDSQALRAQLTERGLVAFVADGAILPRRSGVDDRPLHGESAVPFACPESLRVTLRAPHAGEVSGMGIAAGVSLIVGGGYHGKSTLLRAIERGVYDHIPGDGRERVVTVAEATKIRAEDGRSVTGVDISAFIDNLPGRHDTRHFSTDNASGSTSQAAAIAEALEVGADVLLLDEDTSATNFMIRDARMQRLVADADEPITPFIDRVRMLHEAGVSTVLVVGGAGDYFDVADTVINMRGYLPNDSTEQARRIAHQLPTARAVTIVPWRAPASRTIDAASIDPSRGRREVNIKASREDRVLFGEQEVELSAVEQIVERAQTRAMAQAIVWARDTVIENTEDIKAAIESSMEYIQENGLESIQRDPREPHGDFAAFRGLELAAFINRLRSLRVRRTVAGDA